MLEVVLGLAPLSEAPAHAADAAASTDAAGTDPGTAVIVVSADESGDAQEDEAKTVQKEEDGIGTREVDGVVEDHAMGTGGGGGEGSADAEPIRAGTFEDEDASVVESLLAIAPAPSALDPTIMVGVQGVQIIDQFAAAGAFVKQTGRFVLGDGMKAAEPALGWLSLACTFLKKMILSDPTATSGKEAGGVFAEFFRTGPMSEEAVSRLMHGAMLIVLAAAIEARDQAKLETAVVLYNEVRAHLERIVSAPNRGHVPNGTGSGETNGAPATVPLKALKDDGAVSGMLFELDLVPFSSSLHAAPLAANKAEHALAFKFLIPPSSTSRERFTIHRDMLLCRYLDVQSTVRRCFRCHKFAPLCTQRSGLVDRLWAIACPCGGSFYALPDLHNT
jgi:hypothetical protein